jgi:hypothetical protein
MRDIVLIPTYARPEYLFICLEHIEQAAGASALELWVIQDRHTRPIANVERDLAETAKICAHFNTRGLKIRFTERQPHAFWGNPYNFLEAYKEAYATDARYVYLIEDDVLISPDFFLWHEAVQARADYFVTVGWHCIRNKAVQKSNDPTAYIETTCDYSSIGVCWRRENLSVVVPHANPDYYKDLTGYTDRNFPDNPIPRNQWTEQAGLIMRLVLQNRDTRTVAWPSLPRCAHVGAYGYHRPQGQRFGGDVPARVCALRAATSNAKLLAGMVRDQYKDIEPLPIIPPWRPEDLHVVQSLKWEGHL